MDNEWGVIKSCLGVPRDFFHELRAKPVWYGQWIGHNKKLAILAFPASFFFTSWGKKAVWGYEKNALNSGKKKRKISRSAKTALYYAVFIVHTKFQDLALNFDERMGRQSSDPLLGWPSLYDVHCVLSNLISGNCGITLCCIIILYITAWAGRKADLTPRRRFSYP